MSTSLFFNTKNQKKAQSEMVQTNPEKSFENTYSLLKPSGFECLSISNCPISWKINRIRLKAADGSYCVYAWQNVILETHWT